MTLALLSELEDLRIRIDVREGQLHIDGPLAAISPPLLARMLKQQESLLRQARFEQLRASLVRSAIASGRVATMTPLARARDSSSSEVRFLRSLLSSGPMLMDEVKRRAAGAGLPWRTVQRAMRRAGVESTRTGFGKPATWAIVAGHRQSRHEKSVAPL